MPRMTGCTANLLSSFPLGKRTQLLHESRNFCICRWYMDKPVSQPMFHNVIIAIFHAAISLPWLPCHPAHTYGHGFCPNRTCHLCQTPMLTPGSPTTTPPPQYMACRTACSALRNRPFGKRIRAVLHCKTARIRNYLDIKRLSTAPGMGGTDAGSSLMPRLRREPSTPCTTGRRAGLR